MKDLILIILGGTVDIDLDVISRYAGLTAIECFGIVGMGMISMKDGLTRLLKRESLTKGVEVTDQYPFPCDYCLRREYCNRC